MTSSNAIFGWMFLGLVTTVSLEPSYCRDDDWWGPSGNVLAGTNTPVYFFRPDNDSSVGHNLILQQNAMANLKKESRWFNESSAGRTDIKNECQDSNASVKNLNLQYVGPRIVYPKIVVVVDYAIYEYRENNLTSLLEYLMAVWNGIDLNFRELEHPKIRLNIAGIVVADREDALPFFSRPQSERQLKSQRLGMMFPIGLEGELYMASRPKLSLSSFVEFMETHGSSWSRNFGRYHIAVAMASWSSRYYLRQEYDDRTAEHNSRLMCSDIDTKGPPARVVFNDNGGWWRITRDLTYEIGRSLISSVPSNDPELCSSDESVVTSNKHEGYKHDLPLWSKCLLQSFQKGLNTEEAYCLREKPEVTSPLPRLLPGKILTGDQQCKMIRKHTYCENEGTCQHLSCKEKEYFYHKIFDHFARECYPAGIYTADGTPCGNGKICFRRKCVFEKEIQ